MHIYVSENVDVSLSQSDLTLRCETRFRFDFRCKSIDNRLRNDGGVSTPQALVVFVEILVSSSIGGLNLFCL